MTEIEELRRELEELVKRVVCFSEDSMPVDCQQCPQSLRDGGCRSARRIVDVVLAHPRITITENPNQRGYPMTTITEEMKERVLGWVGWRLVSRNDKGEGW